MYVPAAFAMADEDVHRLLSEHGAADLVTSTAEGLLATMLPFVFDPDAGEHGALLGHVARNNPQWREAPPGEALVIVRGPDAYVSPSWYASQGRARPRRPDLELRDGARVRPARRARRPAVGRGAGAPADRASTRRRCRTLVGGRRAAAAFVAGQLRAIVGLELLITRIEAKAKLSQNRPAADVDGVVAGLAARGHAEASAAVAAARAPREVIRAGGVTPRQRGDRPRAAGCRLVQCLSCPRSRRSPASCASARSAGSSPGSTSARSAS